MTLVADFNPAVAVTFQRMRALLLEGGGLQEGVLAAGDLKGSQRAAGANLSADVAVGAAWVTVDTGARNGATHIYNDAVFNAGPFTAGHATLPRIDQVVLRYNDSAIPTGSGNTPTIEVLTGTATSGATIDNRLGATALPNDCMRLFDVFMPAVASTVTTANIRDRRPWARGVEYAFVRTSGSFGGFAAFASIDPGTGGAAVRLECSGAPMLVTFGVTYAAPALARNVQAQVLIDGTVVLRRDVNVPASGINSINLCEPFVPAAGSHLFAFQLNSGAADGTFISTATQPLTLSVVEQIRVNANNGAA